MTIYIDGDYKCHVRDDGSMTAVDTDAFDGICTEYIEGYRFVPAGQTWTREDGVEFAGEMISPWRPWAELDEAQREYERQQLADMQAALSEALTTSEITAAIDEGVNSI